MLAKKTEQVKKEDQADIESSSQAKDLWCFTRRFNSQFYPKKKDSFIALEEEKMP